MNVRIEYTKKELEEIKKNKYFQFVETNDIWNTCNCSSPDKIGSLVSLLTKNNCSSYEEWSKTFFENVKEEQIIEMLCSFGDELKRNNIKYCVQDIINIILVRCILETWEGVQGEEKIKEWLLEQDNVLKVDHSNEIQDYDGVDFIVTLKNNHKIATQIKPLTFCVKGTFCDSKIGKVALAKLYQASGEVLDVFFAWVDFGEVPNLTKIQWQTYSRNWNEGRKKNAK